MICSKRFFAHLFRDMPEDARITITAPTVGKDNWIAEHADSIDKAVEAAVALDEAGLNAYVGVAARQAGLGDRQVGKKHELAGCGAIWLDLDVGTTGHASKNLPPDEAAAVEIIRALPREPSMIVSSGGGYHVYWLLEQYEDPARVEALCKAWQDAARAAKPSWHIDAKHASTTVLRVPGTHNRKGGAARPVTLECSDDLPRYAIADLEAAATAAGHAPGKPVPVIAPAASVEMTPNTNPVDLGALRECLAVVRRSKAHGTDHQKAQAAILGRVLDGNALGKPGELHPLRISLCGLLGTWLPANTPWEAVRELLRPVFESTPIAPDTTLEATIEKTRKEYERQMTARLGRDAKRAEETAAFKAIAEHVKARQKPPVVVAAEMTSDATPDEWKNLLIEGKDGPRACEHNAELILTLDEEIRNTLRWNNVTKDVEVHGGLFGDTPVVALDTALAGWLQYKHKLMAGSGLVRNVLLGVARSNSYDPIAEYLNDIVWDDVPRIGSFLIDRCNAVAADDNGTDITDHVRRISRMWFIGLVARALKPGCQMDNMLILEGGQGIGKTRLLRALGGRWYLETDASLDDKDAQQLVSGAWLIELGELASLRGRYKGFLTRVVDKFRPPYGRVPEEFPRRCVVVGTTDTEKYLDDPAGLRRFWPVRLANKEIDIDGITRDRDLLLAEAVTAYRAGERWWLNREEKIEAQKQADERARDPRYRDLIWAWWLSLRENPTDKKLMTPSAVDRTSLLSTDIVAELALKLSADRVDAVVRRDIGYAMSVLGFERGRANTGPRAWYYRATAAMLEANTRLKLVP